jgi:hypothetical protein
LGCGGGGVIGRRFHLGRFYIEVDTGKPFIVVTRHSISCEREWVKFNQGRGI